MYRNNIMTQTCTSSRYSQMRASQYQYISCLLSLSVDTVGAWNPAQSHDIHVVDMADTCWYIRYCVICTQMNSNSSTDYNAPLVPNIRHYFLERLANAIHRSESMMVILLFWKFWSSFVIPVLQLLLSKRCKQCKVTIYHACPVHAHGLATAPWVIHDQ